jgi:hypothetical protein
MFGKSKREAATKLQLNSSDAQNATTRSENTHNFGKLLKSNRHNYSLGAKTLMPKKEKPLTKKERDEKRKAKKSKQSKTQTS